VGNALEWLVVAGVHLLDTSQELFLVCLVEGMRQQTALLFVHTDRLALAAPLHVAIFIPISGKVRGRVRAAVTGVTGRVAL
jgi:hypothetical protein